MLTLLDSSTLRCAVLLLVNGEKNYMRSDSKCLPNECAAKITEQYHISTQDAPGNRCLSACRTHTCSWFPLWAKITVESCANGSSSVGDCLHTYLERDFPSIEAIVFPKRREHNRDVLLLDGPELADQCQRIVEVVECLEDLQPKCLYYHEFFPFRHLVTSLRKSVNWVCSPEHLRSRFRTLLNSFDCLETARRKFSSDDQSCFDPRIPRNIWQRIIRLQSGTEVCRALTNHILCTQSYATDCPDEAQSVYQELVHLFLNTWCMQTSIFASNAVVSFSSSVSLFISFPITIFALHYANLIH